MPVRWRPGRRRRWSGAPGGGTTDAFPVAPPPGTDLPPLPEGQYYYSVGAQWYVANPALGIGPPSAAQAEAGATGANQATTAEEAALLNSVYQTDEGEFVTPEQLAALPPDIQELFFAGGQRRSLKFYQDLAAQRGDFFARQEAEALTADTLAQRQALEAAQKASGQPLFAQPIGQLAVAKLSLLEDLKTAQTAGDAQRSGEIEALLQAVDREREALYLRWALAKPREVPDYERVLAELYPEASQAAPPDVVLEQALAEAQSDPSQFLQHLEDKGWSEYARDLLALFGATDDEIESIEDALNVIPLTPEQVSAQKTLRDVFPDVKIEDFDAWVKDNQRDLADRLTKAGRNPDTEAFVRMLAPDITAEQMRILFSYQGREQKVIDAAVKLLTKAFAPVLKPAPGVTFTPAAGQPADPYYLDKMSAVRAQKQLGIKGSVWAWDKLSKEEQRQIAEVYLTDPNKSSQFASAVAELEAGAAEGILQGLVLGPIVSILSPITHQMTGQKVTALDWAVGGAQLALFFTGVVGAGVKAVAGAAAGRAAAAGLLGAGTGIFTADTIANWEHMDTTGRIVAVAMDTLLAVGTAGALGRGRVRLDVKAAAESVAKETGIPASAVETAMEDIAKATMAKDGAGVRAAAAELLRLARERPASKATETLIKKAKALEENAEVAAKSEGMKPPEPKTVDAIIKAVDNNEAALKAVKPETVFKVADEAVAKLKSEIGIPEKPVTPLREGVAAPESAAIVKEQETIVESARKALEGKSKTDSLSKLENLKKRLNKDYIEGLEDLDDAIAEYKDIKRKGMTPEEYNEAKSDAWDAIVEATDNLTVVEPYEAIIPPPSEGASGQPPPGASPAALEKPSVTPRVTGEITPPRVAEPTIREPPVPAMPLENADMRLKLFGQMLASPNEATRRAMTIRLRKDVLAQRVVNMQNRIQELFLEGKTPEEAIDQARRETMTGLLPDVGSSLFQDITAEMRQALFARVEAVLRDEPFELMSTVTALKNALLGKSIPRETGTTGGSAYSRLQRVFGEQHAEVLKALDKGKTLEDIVEGEFRLHTDPIPVDRATADYLASLSSRGATQPGLGEPPPTLKGVKDIRTLAERELAKKQIELETAFLEGRITRDERDIQLAIERERVYPPKRPTWYEHPINDAMKQPTFFPLKHQVWIVRALKEAGLTAVDIGGFIKANVASFDLSWWRQQALLIPGNPLEFGIANLRSWKAIFSQAASEAAEAWIRRSNPALYQMYLKFVEEGMDFLRPTELMKGTRRWRAEEQFGSLTSDRPIPRFTAKIPWVKYSSRGFNVGTNIMNWLLFLRYYRMVLKINKRIAEGKKILKAGEAFSVEGEMRDYARSLSNFTGRAALGEKARMLAPAANNLFFSMRLNVGRILSAKDLLAANPLVRREAWRNLVAAVAVYGGTLFMGKALGWWDVETNPRSADFMKVRIGNSRIDVWGGYQQFVVFFSRVLTRTGIVSSTGKPYDVDPIRSATNLVRSKTSPFAGLLWDSFEGRNFLGERIDVKDPQEYIKRLAPMALQDFYFAFQEYGWQAAMLSLPSLVGFSTQTYSGDWKENLLKLGQPKYADNLAFGLKDPLYDVEDFWADTAADFAGVDPATLTEQKGFPPIIKAVAEALVVRNNLSTLPNQSLIALSADPEGKEPTFRQYYDMWQKRQTITDPEELKKYDADERTRKAYLGNFSKRQLALLEEYHALPLKERALFVEKNPGIGVNPYNEWLKTHPEDNAALALWGQAKVYSKAAYDRVQSMMKQFDIPGSAAAQGLPPEDTVAGYFAYADIVEKIGPTSWEAKLLLAKDEKLRQFLNRDRIDTPVEALELKVKHAGLFRLQEAYAKKDSAEYLDNEIKDAQGKTARDRAVEKLKADNPTWVDDIRRIQAIENYGAQYAESWVERARLVEKDGGTSAEARLWLVDHIGVWVWAREQGLLTDEGTGWNIPAMRIDVKRRKEDADYAALKTDKEKADYLAGHADYRKDRYRRDAYEAVTKEGVRALTDFAETYITYMEHPAKGQRRERMLLGDAAFAAAMKDAGRIKEVPDRKKVPLAAYDDIYDAWKKEFEELEEATEERRKQLLYRVEKQNDPDGVRTIERKYLTPFGEAYYRREAYKELIPAALTIEAVGNYEKHIADYVAYKRLTTEGPEWDLRLKKNESVSWYGDDWFLIEHKDFYRDIYLGVWRNERRDFSKTPSREVFAQYLKYRNTPDVSNQRELFRWEHRDLDDWGIIAFGWKPLEGRKGWPARRP